jgi:hypothetical protein
VKQPRCLPEPRGGGDRPASAMSPMSAEGSQATLSSRPRSARGERSGGAVAARRERPASALPFTAAAPHAFEQPAEIHARQLYLNTCAPSSSSSCSAIRICPPTHDLAPEYKNAGPALGIPRWAANAAGPSSASLTRAACLAGAVGTRLRRAPPPLPYKADTSRPFLRTNWTRLPPQESTVAVGAFISGNGDTPHPPPPPPSY